VVTFRDEFPLVGDILCSDNATAIEDIELLFVTFHIYDNNIQEVKKFAHSLPDKAYLLQLSCKWR